MPRLSPVCSELFAGSPSDASRSTSGASSAPLPRGFTMTPASSTFSPPVLPPLSTGRRFSSFVTSVRSVVASFLSPVIRPSSASPSVCHLVAVPVSPNHALQRTATLAFSYRSAVPIPTGSVTACAPAMKPSTCRAFASPRFTHTRASGSRSLSLGSLGDLPRVLR